MNKTMITEHFSLAEMTRSDALCYYNKKNGTDKRNDLCDGAFENLQNLCLQLEKLRAHRGKMIRVTSGYRSEFVNKLVRGAAHSLHKKGLAADLFIPMNEMADLAAFAMELPKAREVFMSVNKDGTPWLHFAISPEPCECCRVGIDYNGSVRYALHFKNNK